MRRSFPLVFAFLTGFLGTASDSQPLESRLKQALAVPALAGSEVGALVVRDRDHKVLFDFRANRDLIPASNLKVLTAVAALSHWGAAHRFTTVVVSDRAPDLKGEVGELCLRGGGDPLLTSEEWWRLAADLRLEGVRRINGDVFLDASMFDSESYHPSWGEMTDRAYHGRVAALSANYGAFKVTVRPGKLVGERPRVLIDPPIPYLVAVNRSRMVSGNGSKINVSRVRKENFEEVHVSGDVSVRSSTRSFYRNVADPVRYAGSVFEMQLKALGIALGGEVRLGAGSCTKKLLAFSGQPLSVIVHRFLKWSNNNIGEMLLKSLGASAQGEPGSWLNGIDAARSEIAGLGVNLGSSSWVDGSGLSRGNRLSASTLVDVLLRAKGDYEFGAEFRSSLPIGGIDGTLRGRTGGAGSRVRAKTGLISGVMGLSGYVASANGESLTFAVLVNGFQSSEIAIVKALDAFASVMVR